MKESSSIDVKAVELVAQIDAVAHRIMLEGKHGDGDDVALSRQEFRVIHALGVLPVCTMGGIAAQTALSMSGLTVIVDRLVRKQFVTRERSEADRRVVCVALTAGGRRLWRGMQRGRLRMARAMLAPLSDREQDDFLELMRRIGRASAGGKGAS